MLDNPIRTVGDLRRALDGFKDSAPLYCSVNGQAFEPGVAEQNIGVIVEVDLSKPVEVQ